MFTGSRDTTKPRYRRSRRPTSGSSICPAAFVGILFLIVGLFLIQEVKAGRVGETDATLSGPLA